MKFGKLAQSFGATCADERGFAVFPSKTHGEAAMAGLLSQNYRGMNLGQIARKYEGTGNWPAWAARVSKETGLGINDTPNFDDPEKMKAFQRGVAGAEDAAHARNQQRHANPGHHGHGPDYRDDPGP